MLFKELLAQSRDQAHILEILLARRHTFVAQNHRVSVGYTTAQRTEDHLYKAIFL